MLIQKRGLRLHEQLIEIQQHVSNHCPSREVGHDCTLGQRPERVRRDREGLRGITLETFLRTRVERQQRVAFLILGYSRKAKLKPVVGKWQLKKHALKPKV